MPTRVNLQPAFVLHSRPYSDTSLIVEFLTPTYGRLSLLARGARSSRSRLRGILRPFLPLLISWAGKTDLATLTKVETSAFDYHLDKDRLLSGFYLNELIMRLLQRHDPHPLSFNFYQATLAKLQTGSIPELALRLFEKQFLADIGYGLQLAYDIEDNPIVSSANYTYAFGFGFMRVAETSNLTGNYFCGATILALHHETLISPGELREAKRLMRLVLAAVLGAKPLKSRELFVK